MGYYTRLTGELKLDPMLNPIQVQSIKPASEYPIFEIKTVEDEVETSEAGWVDVDLGSGIGAVMADEIKAYRAAEELQHLVDQIPDDISISGMIRGEGEDAGDVRRYFVDENRRVVEEEARLLWPDGATERGRK